MAAPLLPTEKALGSDPEDPSIEELVHRCQAGDREAFNELVTLEQRRVFRLAYRITGSREDLDDLVQDIFLLVYRKIGTFRLESRFSTWLTRIAIHECKKALRKQRARRILRGAEPEEGVAARESLETRVRRHDLRRAVARLPEKHRIVVILRYFEDLRCEEIAQVVDCKAATVRTRLFHARRRLKDMMLQHEASIGGSP